MATALGIIPQRYGRVEAPRENLLADPRQQDPSQPNAGQPNPGQDGPREADLEQTPWPRRLVIRDLLSLHEKGGRIGGKVCHRADPNIDVAQGNHSLKGDTLGALWPASPITVLHVPERSYAQFENKIRVGGGSLANNATLKPNFGWHWRADYERLQAGTLEQEWRARQLTAEQVGEGLSEGRLVYDDRLAHRVAELVPGALRPDLLRAILSDANTEGADGAAGGAGSLGAAGGSADASDADVTANTRETAGKVTRSRHISRAISRKVQRTVSRRTR